MTQDYKAVYFPDFPAETARERSVTLAFGQHSHDLYEYVKNLTSKEIRLLLGTDSYQSLAESASQEDQSVNSLCLRRLRQSISVAKDGPVQYALPGIETTEQLFDPVTVTFRGGSKEPYQRWYSYLEGYSPEYVDTILRRYSPEAKVVLDPFSGTGTTAFTCAEKGKLPYFCEVNPVLQFISTVKIQVRTLDSSMRAKLAEALKTAIKEVETRVAAASPDCALRQAYDNVFKGSEFFDPIPYDQVLRVRTWIDKIACQNPLLGDLLTVAALAALVPASRMKRAGDLRYKRPRELESQMVAFTSALRQSALEIVQDLRKDVPALVAEPILICENAHSLSEIPSLGIEAVITSPPYVNGTNYFRNTKIELWFLRCLHNRHDLAAFRASAVTAGINGVTAQKVPTENHPEVEIVVRELEQYAYDSRIPRMVASYFGEMADIFDAIRAHLAAGATVAIDIGDSAYADVHVPSDQLLIACLQDLGFALEDEVILRQRRSRGGRTLKQSLLILRYRTKSIAAPSAQASLGWQTPWESFKRDLPHQRHPYTKRNWGHPRHSLCSYTGKLKPAIAHHLVEMFVPAGGSVLDPFAGVGTIPFEASLSGRLSFGFDLSPIAVVISGAKLQQPRHDDCERVIKSLKAFLSDNKPTKEELGEAKTFGFNGKLIDYYHAQTLEEILLARRFFKQNLPTGSADMLVMASLLHILHGNRPYALSRRSHPLTPYKPTGEFEYRPLIPRLRDKMNRSLSASLPPEFRSGKMFEQDATSWWPLEVNSLDAVITSPPFFDSTRFYMQNWLRLWFSGWSSEDFEDQPLAFVDERQKESFRIYEPIIRQSRERLKSGGVLVLHLGKSRKCDMADELVKVARPWFSNSERFDESVVHCESHGMRDKGTVTSHQYLLLY